MNKKYLIKSALTVVISTLFATHSVFADELTNSTLSLKDIFNLEYAANPVVTPDGKYVVYERRSMDIMTDSVRRNLWSVALDGSAHLPILSDSKNHFNPVFSPDGAKMAYLSSKEGKVQVYLQDLASNNTTRVTDVSMSPSGMSFSPDGKYLGFAMFTPTKAKPLFSLSFKPKDAKWAETPQYIDQTNFQRDGMGMKRPGNMQVYVVPTIGGTPRQITTGEHDHAGTITWSKNGKQLIISANTTDEADFDMLNSDLFSIDINTSKLTKLTDMSGPERNPLLSPNGNKIAFVGNEDNGKSNQLSQLYVMNLDGSDIENLTSKLDRSVGSIKWATNGKGLYFSYDDMGKKNVAYVNLSGEMSIKTTNLGGTTLGRPYTSGNFDVTPKGSVVYTSSVGNRPADLAIVTSKGKTKQLIDLNGDVFDHKTVN
jgi:Tol biopolymer transport system component